MIYIKSTSEITKLRRAGKIVYHTFETLKPYIKAGVTTEELDKIAEDYILSQNAFPSFKNYNGFPKSICTSVNSMVIHGIPGLERLKDGDIISIDIGACLDGYHGDACRTFAVGSISAEAQDLIDVTRQSFFEGIKYARPGYRISDVSHAVQTYVEANGFSVVREYVGHGIGEKMHEPPEVPNYGVPGHGPRLAAGMTIAVEPMVNFGSARIRVLGDDWTVVTVDGSISAHYENTILITNGDPEILTVAEDV